LIYSNQDGSGRFSGCAIFGIIYCSCLIEDSLISTGLVTCAAATE